MRYSEALFGTVMDIPDKTKDNVKARVDLATLCDRPRYEMKTPRPGRQWRKTPADFVLTRPQKKEALEWIQKLQFPDGYVANLRRGVNLTTMRINGLKSHDYHIWIERLLPVMVRGYLPDNIWRVLAELSNFFRQLCAKELSWVVISDMEKVAPVLLCKLEKIFPPAFFNPMQHLLLHLPYEARMGGLCSTVGAIQLRDVRRSFERNAKINVKLKLLLQSHIFWRRCQTSQPNTMVTIFPACIIHPLVTMLAIMNRVSASSEDNLEVQVMRGTRP